MARGNVAENKLALQQGKPRAAIDEAAGDGIAIAERGAVRILDDRVNVIARGVVRGEGEVRDSILEVEGKSSFAFAPAVVRATAHEIDFFPTVEANVGG